MRIEINSGGIGSGLAVMEYQSSFSGVISSVDSIISSFKVVRTSTINLPGGTGGLYEAVESIDARIAKEEEKKNNAIEVRQKTNSFLDLAIRVDKQVASLVNKNKDEFYRVNPWLKPVAVEEKSWLQKAWDWACGAGKSVAAGFGQAVDWIKDTASKAWSNIKEFYEKHIKAIATALLVIAAIAIIVLVPGGGLLATMLIGAAWGVIAGAAIGGISGGMQSLANGESFWSGFENGAFSGALSGAVAGAAFAGLGFAGQAIGHSISAFSTLGKAIQVASTVTKVFSIGMGAFDTLALADLIIDPSSNLLYDLNSYAHSSSVYNGIQIGAGVLAAFTGGMASTLNTQVSSSTTPDLVAFDDDVYLAQDPLREDRYFVQGNHGDDYIEYWKNADGGYTRVNVESPQIQRVNAKDIEGVWLSDYEYNNPNAFWNKRYSRAEYMDFVSGGGIGNEVIEVELVDNKFYAFTGMGRHRIIAAQIQNIDISVVVKSIVTKIP